MHLFLWERYWVKSIHQIYKLNWGKDKKNKKKNKKNKKYPEKDQK